MDSDAPLPRTPIEWYMFGAALVGLNVIGLLVTGHTLPSAVAMGTVVGLLLALLVVFLTAAWNAVGGGDGADGSGAE